MAKNWRATGDMRTMRKFPWPLLLCLGTLPVWANPVFHLNPSSLPAATLGKAYIGGPLVLQGGGECPRNVPLVRVVGGSLPAGIYLTPAGQFGGAPAEAGRHEFIVRVENACGWSDQPMSIDVTGAPFFSATPTSLAFRVMAGQTAAPASLQIAGNSPGLAYTVESATPWLRARARNGLTPPAGSGLIADLIDVEIDSATLAPGQYRGSIVVGGWRTAQPVTIPVFVEVIGPTTASVSHSPADGRLPQISFGPVQAGAAHLTDPHGPAHGAAPAPKTNKPVAIPGRLSRSSQLRSKYLAAKSAAPAQTPAADPHAKPSPVGEPVKKAEKPAADAHAKPADVHAKPADAHAKPADAHAKPAAKPADAHAKPADAHANPAAKPAEAHAKPKEAAKH